MTDVAGIAILAILLFAAAFHLYWGFGGKTGASVSLPQRDDGRSAIKTSASGALAVGVVLLLFCLPALGLLGMLPLEVPRQWLRASALVLAALFLARALSWSRYVGLFKRLKTTRFAKYDTRLYSPLSLILGLCWAALAFR